MKMTPEIHKQLETLERMRRRMVRLLQLNGPDIIIENERRMMLRCLDLIPTSPEIRDEALRQDEAYKQYDQKYTAIAKDEYNKSAMRPIMGEWDTLAPQSQWIWFDFVSKRDGL